MRTVSIQLGSRSYDIRIGSALLSGIGAACTATGLAGRAAVVSNPTVAPLYAAPVVDSLAAAGFSPVLIEIPDGEEYKTAATLEDVYDHLIEAGIDRRDFIVALGGGVVGDLAGFAAATYLRGIPFVQIPTTLLAQVDSSVGGKTGIDHPKGKNLIGAFYQPSLVLADLDTLSTLSERHYRAGLAEVVKYGAVLDGTLFELLEAETERLLKRDAVLLGEVVATCCRLKAWVVEQDERESGLRAVLNYGHTLGHAFETLGGYRELVHGEAVAIGMACAAEISRASGFCSAGERDRLIALLRRLDLPVAPPETAPDLLAATLAGDKKSHAGTLSYICNRGIGDHAVLKITPAELSGRMRAFPGDAPFIGGGEELELIELSDEDMIPDEADAGGEDTSVLLATAPVVRKTDPWATVDHQASGPEAPFGGIGPEADVDDELPLPEFSSSDDPMVTPTVAELYLSQGFGDRAREIYRVLHMRDPDDSAVAARLAELEGAVVPDAGTVDGGAAAVTETVAALSATDRDKVAVLEGWLENVRRLRTCR